MPKKKFFFAALGILILAGCGNGSGESTKVSNQDNMTVETRKENTENDGMIKSIKEAMGLGRAMKCTYKMEEEGGMEAIAFVDGEKYKMEVLVADKKQQMVFDGETMFSWGEGDRQGMKMTKDCLAQTEKNLAQNKEGNNLSEEEPAEVNNKPFENAVDVQCAETSGIDFSVPAEVTFLDQCEMMNTLFKNGPGSVPPGLPTNIPSGVVPGNE